MKVEARQSHVQNVQLRDDPTPTPSGSDSSVDVGGQNVMVMMDEEDAVHAPFDGSRGFSNDGCGDVKEESVEFEYHDEEVLLEVSVSPKAEPFAGEDERNSNRLSSSNKCVDGRQLRQRQPRQPYSTVAPFVTDESDLTGSNQQTIKRVPGENPSYTLLKQLQADLLNAFLEKEDVVLENKILREKLKACEKKVKELTKKLSNLSHAHQTQGSTKTQTQQPSFKKKKESIGWKKVNLKESKGKKESRTKLGSLKIKIKTREQTERGSVTSVVSPVEVDDDNIAALSAKKETLSSLSNTMSVIDVVHVDVDVDNKIDSLEVVEDWDIEDCKPVVSEDDNDEDYKHPTERTSPADKSTRVRISPGSSRPGSKNSDNYYCRSKRAKRNLLPKDENGDIIRPVCDVCSRVCRNRAKLKEHMGTHSEERPFKCTSCDKAFVRQSDLKQHSRSHSGEKPYACEVCGKRYAANSVYRVHMRIHTGQKTVCCPVCSKSFTQKGNLDIHMRVHTGIRPYKCSVCSKTFKQQGTLRQHNRIHTGETPYQCPTCGKLFNSSSQMNRHIRGHLDLKEFQCTQCPKRFNEGTQLTRHLAIHSEARPYRCHICGQAFRRSSHVSQHMRRHSRDKVS